MVVKKILLLCWYCDYYNIKKNSSRWVDGHKRHYKDGLQQPNSMVSLTYKNRRLLFNNQIEVTDLDNDQIEMTKSEFRI